LDIYIGNNKSSKVNTGPCRPQIKIFSYGYALQKNF